MSKTVAVLIDIMSIQKYIFSSNKLKINLGGSYIIENLFNDFETNDLIEKLVYSGGGNSLLYFNTKIDAEEFLKNWTKELLVNYPGISVNCSISENFDKSNFEGSLNELYKELNKNKSKIITKTTLPSYGINVECSFTGLSQENYFEDGKYISKEAFVKIENYEKADKDIKNRYQDILTDKYQFTNELGELGSSKGEDSHIAVVHIDGNSIGDKFKECKTGEERKELSDKLKEAVKGSFKHLLNHIVINYDKISKELDLKPKEDKKDILPIRPIILGGDDITFVCDGKMGVYFAKIYMEKFEEYEDLQKNKLSSCGGVSIVKIKYPFYKAYQIAEELCTNAKKVRKGEKDKGSWLDFNIAYGNISMSLESLRKKHFKVEAGELLMRPYKLDKKGNTKLVIDLMDILKGVKSFGKWPNSKFKKLREILYSSEDDRKSFIKETEIRGRDIRKIQIGKVDYTNLFYDNKTPYLDVIELKEYYPNFAIEEV